jgi:glycosyltransferase involved in cell wall biosynthesis
VAVQLQTILPLLRDHPEIAQLLGRKARERVVSRYTLSANLAALERLYETVASRSPVALGL